MGGGERKGGREGGKSFFDRSILLYVTVSMRPKTVIFFFLLG